ncbi:MAG: hypothetical protein JXA82_17435 [Sedimentisphaerales bacterium]|nr:hypothetical protein [Sedimentisphaerales bacterium]
MQKIIFLFLTGFVFIGGCKKSPNGIAVDEKVEPGEESQISTLQANENNTFDETSKTIEEPQLFLSELLLAMESRNFEQVYNHFDEDLRKIWGKDDFVNDMKRLFECIGDKWKPNSAGYMSFAGRHNKAVCSTSYQLTDDFQSPFMMSMAYYGFGANYKIHHLSVLFPYQGKDVEEVKEKAEEFLSFVRDLDLEKCREMAASEYRDQIQISVLREINEVLQQNYNPKPVGKVEEYIPDGKRCIVYCFWTDSTFPDMRFQILPDKHITEIEVFGLDSRLRGIDRMMDY